MKLVFSVLFFLYCLPFLEAETGIYPSGKVDVGNVHEDAAIGFKLGVPKEWKQIPIRNSERWLVGRYQAKKQYFYTPKGQNYTYDNRPYLNMIAFSSGSSGPGPITGEDEEEEDQQNIVISFENPYKDYLEYRRATFKGVGWHVEEETTTTVRGIDVTCYDIIADKSINAPLRVITWVYHMVDVDLAVEFIMFDSAWPKLKRDVKYSLGSFKTIERTKVMNASGTMDLSDVFSSADTPEERRSVRLRIEADEHSKAIENLPDDWTHAEMGRFLVLNHADKKNAKKVVAQLEAMYKWLEKTFPYLGPEEYVRKPIVRICANWEEERSFQLGGGWSFVSIEILTHKSDAGASSSEWGYINYRLMRFWLQERDRDVYRNLPLWLRYGLDRMTRTASLKGSKMVFSPDTWERNGIREAIREGSLTKPSELLRMAPKDYRRGDTIQRECGAFVRWLIAGKGAKFKLTKTLVEEYLLNLQDVLVDEDERRNKENKEDDGPTTEEAEDAEFLAKQKAGDKTYLRITAEVMERTFSAWSESDWEKLDKAYLKSF